MRLWSAPSHPRRGSARFADDATPMTTILVTLVAALTTCALLLAWWIYRHDVTVIAKSAEAPLIMHHVTRQTAPISYAENPLPVYPQSLLPMDADGRVVARLWLDASGQVQRVAVIERSPTLGDRLDQSVIHTLSQWRFEPATRDHHPVPSTVLVPIDFSETPQSPSP